MKFEQLKECFSSTIQLFVYLYFRYLYETIMLRPLILLDESKSYETVIRQMNAEIFVSFKDPDAFLKYITSRTGDPVQYIYLFFSSTLLGTIEHVVVSLEDTHKYIFCDENSCLTNVRSHYRHINARKIFPSRQLDFYLLQAQVEILFDMAKEQPEDSEERDLFATKCDRTLDEIHILLKEDREIPESQQPLEII